jgi:predicted NAD/FAD-binding protein
MPANRRAWASWNFTKEPQTIDSFPVSVTYDMNRLQGLTSKDEYFVTLNRNQQLDPLKIIREFKYLHPNFEIDTLKSQKKIWNLNGHNNTYYTGSYMGYGFHEDAVKSSVDLVESFFEGEMFT